MKTAEKTEYHLVELQPGYGDGFGIVRKHDDRPYITLYDGMVRVPASAVVRVVGPLDCDEAILVLVGRYVKNWYDQRFLSEASADELRTAWDHPTEEKIHAAMSSLKTKYAN